MKLKELALKLGLELRGDGGVEIFAPAVRRCAVYTRL